MVRRRVPLSIGLIFIVGLSLFVVLDAAERRLVIVMMDAQISIPTRALSALPDPPPPIGNTDVDLHLYSIEGLHYGRNYTTMKFDDEISGARGSSAGGGGSEWISIPVMPVYIVLDATESKNFVDQFNGYIRGQYHILYQKFNISATPPTLNYSDVRITATVQITQHRLFGRQESKPLQVNVPLDKPVRLNLTDFHFQ